VYFQTISVFFLFQTSSFFAHM